MSNNNLTDADTDTVYNWIVSLWTAGSPSPTDNEIGQYIGRSSGSGATITRKLLADGRLEVNADSIVARVFYIVEFKSWMEKGLPFRGRKRPKVETKQVSELEDVKKVLRHHFPNVYDAEVTEGSKNKGMFVVTIKNVNELLTREELFKLAEDCTP